MSMFYVNHQDTEYLAGGILRSADVRSSLPHRLIRIYTVGIVMHRTLHLVYTLILFVFPSCLFILDLP